MATLAWPESREEALALPRLPLDFVRCVRCGHIYNASFDYELVPYSRKPNLMYNKGPVWKTFIEGMQSRIASLLPENPSVVEIGHGDGSFLKGLAALRPDGTFTGFDPNGSAEQEARIRFEKSLFSPTRHIPELAPDMIISRHVLEHLTSPLKFLQLIAFVASYLERRILVYLEVPCVDNAIISKRTVDFYYEHSSQFTSSSFREMIRLCSQDSPEIGLGYNNEVIYALARFGDMHGHVDVARQTHGLHSSHESSRRRIADQLEALHASGAVTVIWGGTGKSAAFLTRHGIDAARFPVVIDSDRDKVDTFVPGTGQRIQSVDWFKDNRAEVVIIPPQWRARDILEEMRRLDIRCDQVLIEHDGALADFFTARHPY